MSSSATVIYQIRIGEPGDVTIGTPAATLTQADMASVPVLAGPVVDPLKGSTGSIPFRLRCVSDTVLFTSSGRLTGLGRLAEIRRSTDGGVNFTTIGTGRISSMHEDGRGLIEVSISDERWAERQGEIFRTTDTVQLHPPGLASAWMDFPAAGTATYTVKGVSGDAVHIGLDVFGAQTFAPVSSALLDALATDLVPVEDRAVSASHAAGNFTSLRFNYLGGDRTVISFTPTLSAINVRFTGPTGLLGKGMCRGGSGILTDAWVYIPGHGLSAGNTVPGRFHFPSGVAVNEQVPLHVGGASGKHPMVLLQEILDGDYGGEAMRYEATAMTTLQAISMQPVWLRQTTGVQRAKWLEPNLYAPYGVVPLVGTDLVLRPVSFRQPQNEDPDTYTVLSASNATGLTWEHSGRDIFTVLEFTSRTVRPINETIDPGQTAAADKLVASDVTVPDLEHADAATVGEIVRRIKTELILSPWNLSHVHDVAAVLFSELSNVFSAGPVRGKVTVPDDLDVQVGDVVSLDMDTLKGWNAASAARTGNRIARLMTFTELTPASKTFEWLDLGAHSQPLAAPAVTITQDGTDPDLVNVAVSGVPSGATAIVEVAAGTVEPTQFDLVRAGVGNETVSFRLAAAGGNAYARARSVQDGRISSDWATDDVALSSRVKIVNADVVRVRTSAIVTWEVASGTGGVQAEYSKHARDAEPTFDGSTAQDFDATAGGFTITNIARSALMVSVQLTPYPGFSAGAVTGVAGDPMVVHAVLPTTSPVPGVPTVRGSEPRSRRQASRSGDSVTMTFEIDDPDLRVTLIEYNERPATHAAGGALSGWTTWTGGTGTPGSATELARSRVLTVEAGLEGEFGLAYEYEDEDGNTQRVEDWTNPANLEAATKALRFMATCFQPVADTSKWSYGIGTLIPNVAATSVHFRAPVILPDGVSITQLRARMSRADATNDVAEMKFYRISDNGVATLLATLTHSTTGAATITQAITESVSTTQYVMTLELKSQADTNDATAIWFEVTYDAPSYVHTY